MTGKGHRFDDSFVIHMIRDFFLALLAIVALELGIRYTLVVYDFNTDFKASTQRAAERLANDVRAIMLNQGGPVAVRTVYPILRKNHEEIGFSIAIQPSPTTVNSIQSLFDFTPKGIPAIWPSGRFQEAQVNKDGRTAEICKETMHTAADGPRRDNRITLGNGLEDQLIGLVIKAMKFSIDPFIRIHTTHGAGR